ncbi:hypothetical protein [Longimicrobium sp.]|uniref:hypothetical protein n=1 Tax=Longimicrobium sp. TaxID=2029185 RepID=UPI002BF20D8A|nr:hypothetical protein [Longimicrobium sp.]HSU16002.1 hypothetical protein [Longimicrobium sp.]
MPEISEQDRLRRRRNVVLLLVFAAIAVLVGLYPTVCTYVDQPQGFWPSYAQAPKSGADALPPLVPPGATEIHTRRDDRQGLHWVRFTYEPADHDRMTSGLKRLSLNEARAVQVVGPGFTPWWTLNPRTMLGKAGNRLEAYEVAGPPHGWLFLDPLSRTGFYWSQKAGG